MCAKERVKETKRKTMMKLLMELTRLSSVWKVQVEGSSGQRKPRYSLELIDPEHDITYAFFSSLLTICANRVNDVALFEKLALINGLY
jgi:hypothetical protein